MTSIEYAYTERDIYTAIVQTAVPIALTAEETALLVDDLIALAEEMPHDDPVSVWYEYFDRKNVKRRGAAAWRDELGVLRLMKIRASVRSASLDRIKTTYPSLKGEQ